MFKPILSFERQMSIVVILLTVSICGCSQTSSTNTPTNTPAAKESAPKNSKITLNATPMGTTNDSAELSRVLKQTFKQRHENFAFKPGTTAVETTTYLKADPLIGIAEVMTVLDVVKESGALDVLLPIEASSEQAQNLKPDPLTLMVTIGEAKFEPKIYLTGVELIHGPTVPHSAKDTLPKEFVSVEVRGDGEYFINEKAVSPATIATELMPRIKELGTDKRVYLILDGDKDIRYRSLSDVAHGVHAAGGTEMYIIVLHS